MSRSHADAHRLDQQNRDIATITTALGDIEEHFDAALHGPPPRDDNEGGGSSSEKADPIRIDILDARREATRDLVSWVNFILMEVNDGTIARGPDRVDVAGLVAFIKRWTPSIIEQCPDDTDTLRKDMRHHATRLKAIALGWTIKRMEVGRCPEQIMVATDDGEEFVPCTGSLWATIRSQDVDLPESVICDQEASHHWSPWQWRDLGRRIAVSDVAVAQ